VIRFGTAPAMGGIPFALSAIPAIGEWLVKRRANATVWTWMVVLLIALLVLSLGGVRIFS